jgi:signal transduction histidine kinase
LDYILRANDQLQESVYTDLSRLRTHCQTAAMDMRSIMNDIHPYLIDRVGLISALESYVNNLEQMHGINVYMFYQNRILKTDRASEIMIYRIIQEALINVVKHSRASEVDIYFKEERETLKIEVLDNGSPPGDIVAGKGLWGMKERANLIGGDIVYSGGEAGFSLVLTVPIRMEVVEK